LTYRPVIDQFVVPVPLDPPSAAIFIAALLGAAFLTARRPAYGLCALILATPIAFAHEIFGTTLTLEKSVLLGVLLGLTTYAGAGKELRNRPAPLLLGALGLYFVATALTMTGAAHPGATTREMLKVVQYAAVFVAGFSCYRLDADDAPLVGAAAIAAIAVACSALAQEIIGAPSGLYIGPAIVPRIAGILEGPNQLSAYCEIAVATLCADVLSFSRAGLFGLAVVAATLAIVGGKAAWHALRPAMLGAIAGLAGSAGWAIYAHTPGVLRISLQPSLYAGGVGNRDVLWRAAGRMWLDRPIFGVGAGNFELELPQYGALGVRTHANSWYLQSLAEGGIVLFAATIALLAAVLATLTQGVVGRLRGASPWIVAALAASIALALHQVVDYLVFYPKVGGAWWLLVGIGAAAISRRS
jgi:O-antigen ligase